MPTGSPMRNTPSTTTADTLHRQPLLSPANSKATHIRNKDGTKLITVPSRKVSNPDSTSLSTSSTSSSISNNNTIISNSTTIAGSFTARPAPAPLSSAVHSASMDYPHNAGSNHIGGKKKKKKKGKQQQQQAQQQQQQQQQQPTTPANTHNHIHNYDHDHHHHHHRHDDYYNEPHTYSHTNGPTSPSHRADQYQQDIKASMPDYDDHPPELVDPEDDEEYYSGPTYDEDDEDSYTPPIQTAPAPLAGKKKNKKKKKKGVSIAQELYQNSAVPSGGNHVGASKKKDRIWNTSTNEERERIKDFWLSLGEDERRSLVKVEKEAVLRKMKEQQKHSCSCSVCGRKRTAIEEELEVLYDAYYEELEQYAHQQQNSKYAAQVPHSPSPGTYSASRIPPPPPPPGPPPGHHGHHGHHHQRVEEIDDDDEFDDEDYDDDDDDDEPLPENDPRPDFFNFGNSLTVQGGILTVADDLLKNDGKKFIEMMEQLAERRMQREEEANAVATGHSPLNMSVGQNHIGHTHSQPAEYDDEEEEDEEYDEEEEYEDDEDDEPDTMTEEQRMEEGRRMFQIFAARMFEQRVLTAYREKVARERQDKLLEELDEEDQLRAQREEKKAKEKEKKKEKKRLQRLAKEEERLKREAEKAREEAERRVIEEQKAEQVRRRKEEQRTKREAEKKAMEEERRRKEEEKKKRLEEEREREAERERKRKEHQERERKKREEAAKKAKEEKEAREKEARERREREERERREKEVKEAEARREAADRERIKREEDAKAKAEAAATAALAAAMATAKRPPVSIQTSMPQHPHGTYNSPHLSVAAPAIPKQPVGHSPNRNRNASQQGSMQGSVASSPKTPQAVPRIGSSASPSTPILQQNIPGPIIAPNKLFQYPPHIPTSPLPHHIAPPPGVPPPDSNGFPMMNHMGMNGPSPIQPFLSGMPQRPFGNGLPMYPPTQMPMGSSPQYRGYAAPNGMPMQVPVAPGMRPMPPQGRGIFMGDLAPGMHQLPPGVPLMSPGSPFIGNRVEPVPIPGVHSHTRALSGSFEPIQRPTPIQRPSSVAPPRDIEGGHSSVDELSKVMGSRALLEDEGPLLENQSPNRRGSSGIGFSPRPARGLPAASPLFMDPISHIFPAPSWSNPAPLGNMSNSLPNAWSTGAGWSETDAARSTFNRRRAGKLDQIRALAAHKCRELGGENSNFIEVSTLQRAVEQAAPPDLSITMKDLTDILDVEGDAVNGGGNFVVTHDTNGRTLVKYEEDDVKSIDGIGSGIYQAPGAPIGPSNHAPHPGEIGSPTGGGFAHPFKTAVGPPPGIAANGLPSPGF